MNLKNELAKLQLTRSNLIIFLIPLFFSLVIMFICYPGFMSYDSVRMLQEARASVRGGIFPVGPVYILRLFDVTGYGVPLMVFAQDFTVLLSVTLLLKTLGASMKGIVFSLLILLSMPTVLGCMLVLWKDVTFACLLLLSMVLILISVEKNGLVYFAYKWSALFLIFIATLVRWNGVTATLVVLAYWLLVFYQNFSLKKKSVVFLVIASGLVLLNSTINSYRLPTFERLEPNTLVYGVMAWDLVGTSKWAKESLVPFDAALTGREEKANIKDIQKVYSSLGSEAIKSKNLLLNNPVHIYPKGKYVLADITQAWVDAISHHPIAYLQYRLDMFAETIGATNHETFEPTHFNRIDENIFGIKFQERAVTTAALGYIKEMSNTFIGKPYFVIVLAFLSMISLIKNNAISLKFRVYACVSFISALMYLAPLVFMPMSGEVRYSLPSILLCFNCLMVWYFTKEAKPNIVHS